MELTKEEILKYQKNIPPYLMMDYITEVVPEKSVNGYKILNEDEWFFQCHFPGDPNMPGMLQVEAIVQLTAMALFTVDENKGKVAYITHLKDAKFLKKVTPNCKLEMQGKILSLRRGIAQCEGFATVENKVVCKAKFSLVLPHIVEQYQIKKS